MSPTSSNPSGQNRSRWLLWLILGLLTIAVVLRFRELGRLYHTLLSADRQWLWVALILQIIYYLAYIWLHSLTFQIVSIKFKFKNLARTLFSAMAMHVALPGSGTALFIHEGSKLRGGSGSRTTAGLILIRFLDYLTFLVVLLFGLIFLGMRHDLRWFELVATFILLLVVALQAYLLLTAGQPTKASLTRFLHWAAKTTNRVGRMFGKRRWLSGEWVKTQVTELRTAAKGWQTHPEHIREAVWVAFLTHILDILSLWAIFEAFGQHSSFSAVVAAFATAILLWIVSPSPQGIGFVEGAMTLVMVSLGIHVQAAILITITFRGLTFWIPFLLGLIWVRETSLFKTDRELAQDQWSVRLASWFTAAMGLVNVFSGILPGLKPRLTVLSQYIPLHVQYQSRLTTILAGFALLVLAVNLGRRKWSAWLLTEVVLVVAIFSNLTKGLDFEEAVLMIVLLIWLFVVRHEFHAKSDPPAFWQGVWLFASSILFTLVYGAMGFILLDRHFAMRFTPTNAFKQTIAMFFQYKNPGADPITPFGHYFADSIYIIGLATLAASLYLLLRPAWRRHPANMEERAHAAEIIGKFGATALAPFALLEDKAYFFSKSGTSVVAYTVQNHVAIALGDPIGPSNALRNTAKQYITFCRQNGWQPTFYSVDKKYLPVYKSLKLADLCMGREAIVETTHFTLEGSENKNVRNAISKMQREGYSGTVWQPPLTESQLDILEEISDEWLAIKRGHEKQFALGWFDRQWIRHQPVAVVQTTEQQVVAFANLLAEPARPELVIDLMRHLSQSPNGTMEMLFTTTFEWARDTGIQQVNLGLSPLSHTGEQAKSNPLTNPMSVILAFAYKHFNDFYNFQGLHQFKAKFHPRWEFRYMIYPPLQLPQSWIAMMFATNGGTVWTRFLANVLLRRLAFSKPTEPLTPPVETQ